MILLNNFSGRFKKTPFLIILIPYILGITVYYYFGICYPHFLIFLCILCAVLFLVSKKLNKNRRVSFLLMALVCAGAANTWFSVDYAPPCSIQRFADKAGITIRGYVRELPVSPSPSGRTRMTVSVGQAGTGIPLKQCSGRLYVYMFSMPQHHIAPGDCIEFRGKVVLPSAPSNPGEADLEKIFRVRGIDGSVFLRTETVTVLKKNAAASLIFRIRSFLKHTVDSSFTADTAPLINSLILGIRNSISRELWSWFRGSGIIHILAISGLHMSLLVGMSYLALTLIGISPPFKHSVLIGITLFYMLISGSNIPAVRTSIMLIVYLLSRILYRKTYIHNTLAAAAFCILLFKPLQLCMPGFILSFTAILSLLNITPLLTRLIVRERTEVEEILISMHPVRRFIKTAALKAFLLSAAAWLGTFPVIISIFGIFTPYSVVANFICVPLVAAILIAGFIFILAAPWAPILAVPLAYAGSWLSRILILGVKLINGVPFSVIHIDDFPLFLYYSCLLIFIIMFRLYPKTPRKKLWVGILASAQLILIYPVLLDMCVPDRPELHIIDVGHGDCALMRHEISAVMVDTGSGRKQKTVESVLRKLGVSRIDLLILSHYDEDHSGNVIPLIDRFGVRNILVPVPFGFEKAVYARIKKHADKKDCRIVFAHCTGSMNIGKIHVEVLSVPKPSSISANERSIVCRISCCSKSVLFTGDIETYGLRMLLSSENSIRADILKAPHHGRTTEYFEEFLSRVRPRIVYLPQGKRDMRKSERIRSLLSRSGVTCLSTAESGYIRINFDNGMDVYTFRKISK